MVLMRGRAKHFNYFIVKGYAMKNCYGILLAASILVASPMIYGMDDSDWWQANAENFLRFGMSREKQEWTLTRCALMMNEALHYNAANGDVKWVVKLIKDYHFPVDLRNYKDETPMEKAAAAGNFAVIDALMTAGANLNLKDKQGKTILEKIGRADVLNYIGTHYPPTGK
jgi:hypothetical protein